jgi:hypothetical protein
MGDQQPAAAKTKEVHTVSSVRLWLLPAVFSVVTCVALHAQDREVDAALQALQNKVQGVKGSLSSFVGKMEHEPLTW